MNVFFKMLFFVFCFSSVAVAQSPDMNAPAPESPTQIRIPHSDRTKDNILDTMVDMMLVRYFKQFDHSEISYDFLEIDQNADLVLTNFKVKVDRSDIKGAVLVAKAKVNFSEFLTFLKEKRITIGKVLLSDVKADMALIRKEGETEKRRELKYKSGEMILQQVQLVSFEKEVARRAGEQDIKAASVSAKTASLTLTDPAEAYGVAYGVINDVVLPHGVLDKFKFSSAEVNGKTYDNRDAFLSAIKK